MFKYFLLAEVLLIFVHRRGSIRALKLKKKRQLGFTLIEMMIVVAIIGVLAALAAPNFARYQSKARQAESKIGLAAVYAGEKAFYAEYSSYIGDMGSIGYIPEGNKRYYNIGWDSAWVGSVTGFTGAATVASYTTTNIPSTWTLCSSAYTLSGLPATNATDPQTFSAVASGQLRDLVACDIWSIDQAKVLQNVTVNL